MSHQKKTTDFSLFKADFLWFDVHFLAALCFYFILSRFLFFSGQDFVQFFTSKRAPDFPMLFCSNSMIVFILCAISFPS